MAAALTEDVKARIARRMNDLEIISTRRLRGMRARKTRTGQVKREKDNRKRPKRTKDRDWEAPVL
jgi:hypothetical protein